MKEKTLPAIRPNAGIAAKYQYKLDCLINEMHASIIYWLRAQYRKQEKKIIAQDANPVDALRKALRELTKRWQKRFDRGANELAAYFAQSINNRNERQLKAILKRAGISIKMQLTPKQRMVLKASVQANVSLIKSIPQQYLKNVEGDVMRAIQSGHDLEQLTKTLQSNYGVTKRRAKLIARDQNNKVTASLNRAKQLDLGITEAIWVHSGAGKEPRPNHVKFGRQRKKYDVAKGMWDPDANGKGKGAWIQPGSLVNCRCTSRSVIPGL